MQCPNLPTGTSSRSAAAKEHSDCRRFATDLAPLGLLSCTESCPDANYVYPQWHATYVTAMIIPIDHVQTVQTA